jgi:hypothetical protein
MKVRRAAGTGAFIPNYPSLDHLRLQQYCVGTRDWAEGVVKVFRANDLDTRHAANHLEDQRLTVESRLVALGLTLDHARNLLHAEEDKVGADLLRVVNLPTHRTRR